MPATEKRRRTGVFCRKEVTLDVASTIAQPFRPRHARSVTAARDGTEFKELAAPQGVGAGPSRRSGTAAPAGGSARPPPGRRTTGAVGSAGTAAPGEPG